MNSNMRLKNKTTDIFACIFCLYVTGWRRAIAQRFVGRERLWCRRWPGRRCRRISTARRRENASCGGWYYHEWWDLLASSVGWWLYATLVLNLCANEMQQEGTDFGGHAFKERYEPSDHWGPWDMWSRWDKKYVRLIMRCAKHIEDLSMLSQWLHVYCILLKKLDWTPQHESSVT